MIDCNSTSNTATLGGSIYMSLSELVLRNCLFSGDTVSYSYSYSSGSPPWLADLGDWVTG